MSACCLKAHFQIGCYVALNRGSGGLSEHGKIKTTGLHQHLHNECLSCVILDISFFDIQKNAASAKYLPEIVCSIEWDDASETMLWQGIIDVGITFFLQEDLVRLRRKVQLEVERIIPSVTDHHP